jgi:hypothetical protein
MKWEQNHSAVNRKNLGAGGRVLFKDCELLRIYPRKTEKDHDGVLRRGE